MKYTKEQIDGMHNDDISKLLCALLGFNVQNFVFEGVVTIEQMGKVSTFDMMDWSDIMPLAVEHGISLVKLNGEWMAIHQWIYIDDYYESTGESCGLACDASCTFPHKSPQRAIACCLILVLQERQQ